MRAGGTMVTDAMTAALAAIARLVRQWNAGQAMVNATYSARLRIQTVAATPSRSSIVHWMLEELGEPYEIHLVSFKKGENRTPEYLAINPMGKVPTLRHRDVVITEASAICAYLADEFPRAKLNVPIGNPRRGMYLKWLFFGPSCVEPAIWEQAYPRKEPAPRAALGFGEFDTVVDVLAKAAAAAR